VSFFQAQDRSTDLNQAEVFSPLDSSPLPDLQLRNQRSGEEERKNMTSKFLDSTLALAFFSALLFTIGHAYDYA
jgi:hypothetical protein